MKSDTELLAIIEALLFASGDPLSIKTISDIIEIDENRVQDLCQFLLRKYENDEECGIQIRQLENAYCITTKPELKEYLARLFRPKHLPSLSNAAYETLAAIAYNQPVTKSQIELVRGVNSDSLVNRLVERGYVEETGQLDLPGRPAVFSTTQKFLLEFGLKSTDDLPNVDLLMYDTIERLQEE